MINTPNTVLVIDDNEINRKYLKSVLSNNGFNPIIAQDGYEALKLLENYKVNLILVDIQMPEMDGFECYRQIKAIHNPTCPILAITAFSDQADKKEIIAFGFNDYIIKPVKPNVLMDTLNYWITGVMELDKSEETLELQHIDSAVLNNLLRFTDEESLLALIDEFVEETKTYIQSLAFLRSTNRHPEILSILHVIKGNAGSFGFSILSSKASSLEAHFKEKRYDQAESELEVFLDYSESLLRDYQRLLKID